MKQIGKWGWDSEQLPKYEYTGDFPFLVKDKYSNDSMLPEDPCFILGNYRMTLFTHVSGKYEFITGERGWARLNHGGKNLGWNQSVLRIINQDTHKPINTYSLVGVNSENNIKRKQSFGIGYSSYTYECPEHLIINKVISVKPSMELHKGNPSFLVNISLENRGISPITVQYSEQLLANYMMMNDQGQVVGDTIQRVKYANQLSIEAKQQIVKADISFHPLKLLVLPENSEQRFTHDIYPPTLFIKAVESDLYNSRVETSRNDLGDLLCAEVETVLKAGEQKTVQLVIGLTFGKENKEIESQVQDMLIHAKVTDHTGAYAHLWRQVLPALWEEPDHILRCEMIWNSYVLEAMATYSQYFKETFIPQGSVYAYHLGQNASNRDHLQHLLPLIYTNPKLAKSCIRYAMQHTLEDGEIRRQNIGYGYSDPGIYMESDPQIYMIMAVGEYLRITKDYAFLSETITYYPVEHKKTNTVLNLLIQHFIYLRDVIGTGQHGLVKMLNSDWSDSFFHPYSPNIYSLFAESHMNTTMALAVIPPLLKELKRFAVVKEQNKELIEDFINELKQYREALFSAFMHDMEGRTFAPRCYIGEHDEPHLKFGVDSLCLEAQPFLLQMEDFPMERKQQLYLEIKNRVLEMEKVGARTREIPLWSKGGQGEDGGIWFSHQGPLIVGIASFDRGEALKLMKKLTFHNYAEQYPEYWVGHWTFADSLESTLSKREGLYHFWTQGAFQPFCAHVHAWMLYCYYRVIKE
jgi:cellobiose phosphorylase